MTAFAIGVATLILALAYGTREAIKTRQDRLRKIPRRSTLIVIKGEEEPGRIVANPGKEAIKELMDTALTASTP